MKRKNYNSQNNLLYIWSLVTLGKKGKRKKETQFATKMMANILRLKVQMREKHFYFCSVEIHHLPMRTGHSSMQTL